MEKKEQKNKYEITEIATETAPAYHDTETDERITQFELLMRIANDLEKLKKQLV
jgi:hypothetical protein